MSSVRAWNELHRMCDVNAATVAPSLRFNKDKWAYRCSLCCKQITRRRRGVAIHSAPHRELPGASYYAFCRTCINRMCRVLARGGQ